MINTISGAVSLYIYKYDKEYYFFGDVHDTRKNNCYDKGMTCDAFNYNFTATTNANTNCTTLGALLYNWFRYNNDQHIKTDFYLEEYYTKENERPDDVEFTNMIKNRSIVNTRQGSPFKDKSWMQLLPYIMAPCFIREKQNCPFYPNVHLHYTDVRTIVTSTGLVDMTPFSIQNILIYIIEHQPTSIEALSLLRDDILNLIHYFTENFKTLFYYLMNNQIDEYKKALLSTKSAFVLEIIDHIDYFISNGQFKIAKELQRLKIKNPSIHDQLLNYVDAIIDKTLVPIKQYQESLDNEMRKYNTMKKRNVLHVRGLRRGYEDLLKIIKGYDLLFVNLETIIMDIYTLARMFIQDGDVVIVYAGAYHINIYKDFFNLLTEPLLSIPYQKGNNCLTHDDIPLYIHANEFKL